VSSSEVRAKVGSATVGQEQEWVVLMGHSQLKEIGVPNGKIGNGASLSLENW